MAVHGQQMAFDRRTHAVRNQRHAVRGRLLHDEDHLVGAEDLHHRVGRHRRVRRFVAAVLFAHGGGGREALAETLRQRGEQGLRAAVSAKRERS